MSAERSDFAPGDRVRHKDDRYIGTVRHVLPTGRYIVEWDDQPKLYSIHGVWLEVAATSTSEGASDGR